VAALRGKEDVDLTSNIKIVCSARKAGINHWSTGRCEWAGAIRDDRHVRDRSRSGWHFVKVEDPHGQTEFGRQLLDRAGAPTGQHRIQTTSPRLRGHKMPRIAVGAVNRFALTGIRLMVAHRLIQEFSDLGSDVRSTIHSAVLALAHSMQEDAFIRTRIDAGIERLVIQIFSMARRDRIANR
jgi:hypothetical protein